MSRSAGVLRGTAVGRVVPDVDGELRAGDVDQRLGGVAQYADEHLPHLDGTADDPR